MGVDDEQAPSTSNGRGRLSRSLSVMARPINTAKLLEMLGTMHDKEAQVVGVLRTAGIGETTIARSMRSSPQAIAKRFPMVRATATRATTRTAPKRATVTRARATKRTTAPAARARGKVGARAR